VFGQSLFGVKDKITVDESAFKGINKKLTT